MGKKSPWRRPWEEGCDRRVRAGLEVKAEMTWRNTWVRESEGTGSPESKGYSLNRHKSESDPDLDRGVVPAESPSDLSWLPGPGQLQQPPLVLAPETRCGSSDC